MQARLMRVLPAALVLSAILAPSAVPASDDDERPAYMIYLDPETGRYTTEDPMPRRPTAYAVQATTSAPAREPGAGSPGSRAPDNGKADRAGPLVLGAGAALLLAAFARRLLGRRRRFPGPS